MTVRTCTKVNIGLHVLRRRPDGYHDLETLFVPYYGLGDELTIEPAARTSIEIVHGSEAPWDPQQDLTIRAWRLLKADFPNLPDVSIRLVKGAPVGAGLGGGSADAALALKLIRDLGGLDLSDADLAAYAARLGSDCAFFVHCRPMFGTGRGEILEPADIDLSGYDLRVEVPEGVAVSTREAYAGITPNADRPSLKELLRAPAEEWKDLIINDFEKSVFAAHPEIPALKQSLYERGAIYAAMSGSGSAVFGLFRK
ncbi:MAG: 4-(cytidine 5'-diphospho)-2-C-methyl-D-erythritol kinase [Bacteroidales bacterium]|nr:4-(cytidine 5'-diphospho)-2-C-methyl-D-erythritol kinase [Bacteroidales bacterium]